MYHRHSKQAFDFDEPGVLYPLVDIRALFPRKRHAILAILCLPVKDLMVVSVKNSVRIVTTYSCMDTFGILLTLQDLRHIRQTAVDSCDG
jgi:hypothetical protein